MTHFLGIAQDDADIWFQAGDVDGQAIDALIEARKQAKLDKDFARADAIRDELLGQGIVLEDSPQGTRWKKA